MTRSPPGWGAQPALVLAALFLALLSVVPGPAALAAPYLPRVTGEPLDDVAIGQLGYSDSVLRGRNVSAEFTVPGPGDYLLGDDNTVELDYSASTLLAPESVLSVLWNGLPLGDWLVRPSASPTHLHVRLPLALVRPGLNQLQVQAQLVLQQEQCPEDNNPARHLTVYKTTRVRYSYLDRLPHPGPLQPDVGRFPWPFFQPDKLDPPAVRFVTAARPSSSDLTALAGIAAKLGQAAGQQGVPLALTAGDALQPADAAASHLIVVGRSDTLPVLESLPHPALSRRADGLLVDEQGQPVAGGTGVVYELASPWNPARAVLVVTGNDDAAVARGALSLSSAMGLQTLRGSLALVPEASVATPAPGAQEPAPVLLSDLGLADVTVTGSGGHGVPFSFDPPAIAGRAALPFNLVISRSPLLDAARSSVRVVVNGVALSAVSLRSIPPERGAARINLPVASLRPAGNSINVEFTLYLPAFGETGPCPRQPGEQAWAVLHAESGFEPPVGGQPAAEHVTLSDYPYPCVRGGKLDTTLLVVPEALGDGVSFARLAAELGRVTRAETLGLRVVRAGELTEQQKQSSDLVVWGLPGHNPLLAELGDRLPIRVGDAGQLTLSREFRLSVRDATKVGVVQEIGSPWSIEHSVLVVTATGAEGLQLTVDMLHQGGLSGSAALGSRAEGPSASAGSALQGATLEPIQLGVPPPPPVRVTYYRTPARVPAPVDTLIRARRSLGLLAAAIAVATSVITGNMAYQALAAPHRRRGG